ncbi:MAG: hypothetical protein CMJ81_10435 [Planctomycetaceae bacterium]|nr:hypothetical protein [Planctomycetaceae bacterium]
MAAVVATAIAAAGIPQANAQTYSIVDTGQTTFYDNTGTITAPTTGSAFYGQDAQYPGNQSSYTVAGDSLTVYDNNTGLTWQRSVDTDGDGDIDAADKLPLTGLQSHADSLNAQNYGGYSDWRMPTIKEQYSLIDFRGIDPSGYSGTDTSGLTPFIDTGAFDFAYGDTAAGERIIDSQYASSTLYVGNTGGDGGSTLFGVNFADGRIKGYGTGPQPGQSEDKEFFVQCVRGNPSYGINDLVDNGNQTITDNATGMMWSKADSGSGMNWQEALAWVQQKNDENYLGHNDWRLPGAKELQSIVDYSRAPSVTNSAAIDPVFDITAITDEGGKTDYPFFWTSTTHENMQGGKFGVYLAFGEGPGWMQPPFPPGAPYTLTDVHGAGSQRSDPKSGVLDTSSRFYLGTSGGVEMYGNGPQGDVIRIDNYARLVRTVVPNPCGLGGDAGCSRDDLDALYAVFGTSVPPTDALFDLNSDNVIDTADLTEWLSLAATENGHGSPYLRGDTDLDRDVDLTDYNALATNFNPSGTYGPYLWQDGNFDGDGNVDLSDYNSMTSNFKPLGYGAAPVPEPSSIVLVIAGLLAAAGCWRH